MWVIVVDLKAQYPCWVAFDTLNFPHNLSVYPTPPIVHGADYTSLKAHIDSCIKSNRPISLAFEAPMYWLFERERRFPNEINAWYTPIAAQATGQAYFHGYKILNDIIRRNSNITFTYNICKVSPRTIMLFEAFATGDFKVKNAGPGYTCFAPFFGSSQSQHIEDWVDAYLCGIAFYAYYDNLVNGNNQLLHLINNTCTSQKQKLQTLRVDLQGNQYLYLTPTNSNSNHLNKPIYNHWSVILNTISGSNKYPLHFRCEIFGIKFK